MNGTQHVDDIYESQIGFMTRSDLTRNEFKLTAEESDNLVKYQHHLNKMLESESREYFVKNIETGGRRKDFTYYRHPLPLGPVHKRRIQDEIDRVNSFLDCFSGKVHRAKSPINNEIVENENP